MNKYKELKEFRRYKANYEFIPKTIEEIEGKEYCEGYPLKNDEDQMIGECEKWINVGYKHKGSIAKALSNLFPYSFKFRGKKLNSIESFFQGIKFKDINMQNYIFEYSGLDSNRVKVCNDYDWKKTGKIYWQGKEIDRYSKKYEELVDEMYVCAIQNPLYRNVLKKSGKYIMHSIGDKEKNETVFTRHEFEKELNCLKDFLNK